MSNNQIATVEIRGLILPYEIDPDRTYRPAEANRDVWGEELRASQCCSTPAVLAAIDAARAKGVRVLLVTIDSRGGHAQSGFAIVAALREFSRSGTVVVHVPRLAGSVAAVVAVAGDMVLLDRDARFIVHGARTGDGNAPDAINAAMVEILASRTCSSRETLEAIHARDPDEPVLITAEDALERAWADGIASLEEARALAARIAAVGRPKTARSKALEAFPENSCRHENLTLPDGFATIREAITGIDTLCRIKSIEEVGRGRDARYRVEAYEWPLGVATAIDLTPQTHDGWIGPVPVVGPDAEGRLREAAASNWSAASITAASYYAIAGDGAGGCLAIGAACSTFDPQMIETPRTKPAGTYRGVAFGSGAYVAVGDASVCARTTNGGASFTTPSISPSLCGDLKAIATDGAGTWVAVGTSAAARSTDNGVTFSDVTMPGGTYYGIAYSPRLARFCAVGTNVCATSDDGGATWISHTFGYGATAITWGTDRFIAAAGGAVYSLDGATGWTYVAFAASYSWNAIAFDGWVFAGVFGKSPNGNGIATTRNGIAWVARPFPDQAPVVGGKYRAACWTGQRFVTVGISASAFASQAV